MIRVVALRKAITAGLCGAAVMEVFTFAASKAGIPTVDMVADLGSIEFHAAPFLGTLAAIIWGVATSPASREPGNRIGEHESRAERCSGKERPNSPAAPKHDALTRLSLVGRGASEFGRISI